MAQEELVFGRFRLQVGRQLLADGKPVSLGQKPFNILCVLVAARGDLVTKDELIERIWPGMVVEENAVQAHISALRKLLGEDGRRIATVPGRGYRFDGPVECVSGGKIVTPIPGKETPSRRARPRWVFGLAAVLIAVIGVAFWRSHAPTGGKAVAVERYLVLPFVNRTGDPNADAYSDALTDAVAGRLGTLVWDGQVLGHDVAFAYKGQKTDPMKLAETLGLTYVIDGSVQRTDGKIEGAAAVVDARSGAQIGTISVHARDAADENQPQWLAAGLASQVQWTVTRALRRAVAAGKVDDGDIRNLLARAVIAMRGPSLAQAWPAVAALLDKALALDPRNVHALTTAASARIHYVGVYAYSGEAERTRMLDEAESLLAEAGRIEPTRVMLHLMQGDLHAAQGRYEAARAEYQRASDVDPLSADALEGLAACDIYLGSPEAALPRLNQAQAIDPDDVYLIAEDLAYMRMMLGQDADALVAIRQAAAANPDDPSTWAAQAGLLMLNGHDAEARAALTTLRGLSPGITVAKLRLADTGASPLMVKSRERLYAALQETGLQ